jgi:hypothetical protein
MMDETTIENSIDLYADSLAMSENPIITVQAYFAQKTGFPCPSVGIESGLHRSQS